MICTDVAARGIDVAGLPFGKYMYKSLSTNNHNTQCLTKKGIHVFIVAILLEYYKRRIYTTIY